MIKELPSLLFRVNIFSLAWRTLKHIIISQFSTLQNLSALVFFNFLASGLFFVTQVKIANVIGKESFGLLAYGIALGMCGQTIIYFGMNRTLVRDLIHYPNRFVDIVITSLVLRGILLTLVIAIVLVWRLIWQPAGLTWPVIIVIVAYSLKALDLQSVYDAWYRMARHAFYNIIHRILYITLIWMIIIIRPQHLSLAWIAVSLLIAEVFFLLLQQQWAWPRIRREQGSMSVKFNNLMKIGRSYSYIAIATMGLLCFGSLNQMILKHYSGY